MQRLVMRKQLNEELDMDWDLLSIKAKSWMMFLGDFGPTIDAKSKTLKGYMHDEDGGGKVYITATELRELADCCNEVADWLDKRAVDA